MRRAIFVGPYSMSSMDYFHDVPDEEPVAHLNGSPAMTVRLYLLDDRDVVVVSNEAGDVEWRFSIGALRAFAETHGTVLPAARAPADAEPNAREESTT